MTTFLQICQDVARESGTIPRPSGKPTSTTNQSGALDRIVNWVQQAYEDVQRHKKNWRWKEATFSQALTASVQTYSAANVGITNFKSWTNPKEFPRSQERQFTIYRTSEGKPDQKFMIYQRYEEFFEKSMTGPNASQTGEPIYITIDPAQNLIVWPIPDSVGYTLEGHYIKGLDVLSGDSDTPEFDDDFHRIIQWGALVKLGVFDEAPANRVNYWNNEYQKLLRDMEEQYLPDWVASEPLT